MSQHASLSSLYLDAFAAVSRHLSFSRAGRELHVTQSALSQRIANLEHQLGLALFHRDRSGVRLTEPGLRLVRYCQSKTALEAELRGELVAGGKDRLAGRLRIAGYSTVLRSIVIPKLAPLLRQHPGVQVEIQQSEMRDIPTKLLAGEADFIVLDHELIRAGVEAAVIGEEKYVLIESSTKPGRTEVVLDHDSEDTMTERFFRHQRHGRGLGKNQSAPLGSVEASTLSGVRSFLNDIYSIIDGVSQGLGRAVVPEHLLGKASACRIVPGHKPLIVPIVLHYFTQPYYSRLTQSARQTLL